jgi:hypothetical protein
MTACASSLPLLTARARIQPPYIRTQAHFPKGCSQIKLAKDGTAEVRIA